MVLDLLALSDFAVADRQPFPVRPYQFSTQAIFRALRAQRSYRSTFELSGRLAPLMPGDIARVVGR